MQFLRNLGVRFSEARRRYKAYNELMQLDDRTLSDIGIARSQIDAAVFGSKASDLVTARVATVRTSPAVANGNQVRHAA